MGALSIVIVRPEFVRRKVLASDALSREGRLRPAASCHQGDVHREALEAGEIVGRDRRKLPELGMRLLSTRST